MRYFKPIFFKERERDDDEAKREGRCEGRECDVAGGDPVAAVTAAVLLPLI